MAISIDVNLNGGDIGLCGDDGGIQFRGLFCAIEYDFVTYINVFGIIRFFKGSSTVALDRTDFHSYHYDYLRDSLFVVFAWFGHRPHASSL